MFTDFNLLAGNPVWQRVITSSPQGNVVDGVYYPPESTTNYVKFSADIEPYGLGQQNNILPEGVSSRDAIILYTDNTSLLVHNDLRSSATKASVIYIEDPMVNSDAHAYVCFYRMPWISDLGMTLLTSDYIEIVCIREEKL